MESNTAFKTFAFVILVTLIGYIFYILKEENVQNLQQMPSYKYQPPQGGLDLEATETNHQISVATNVSIKNIRNSNSHSIHNSSSIKEHNSLLIMDYKLTNEILITSFPPNIAKTFQVPRGQSSWKHCYRKDVPNHLDAVEMPCRFTSQSEDFDKSDAVLFRAQHLRQKNMLPQRHTNAQNWILYEDESPGNTWQWLIDDLSMFDGVFNLTATMVPQADIQRSTKARICSVDEEKEKAIQHQNYAEKKRTDVLVAWFVSHCKTQSKREKYVAELSKYMAVDIYGKCGDKKCGSNLLGKSREQSENCSNKLLHGNDSYKFYLSFENSLCPEYVTEKLWKVLTRDIVPVVMGGVDYSAMLPTNTYIDVKDFKKPKDLAEYLLKLNQSDALYNEYVHNKNILKCKWKTPPSRLPFQCKICKYLHETKGTVNIVEDVEKVYGPSLCMTPKEYLSSDDA